MNGISVVIPTYNRNDQLSDVLDKVLESDVTGLVDVEVIVVDDGSPIPAEKVVKRKKVREPFELRYLRQKNYGPAAARNYGLREARKDIVLFVDDDVIVLPDVLRKHIAAHELYPDSVIFGPYPYVRPSEQDAEYRFLQNLVLRGIDELPGKGNFIRVSTVASGNLSIEKKQFEHGLYEPGLTIPVSEEYALIYNLFKKKIATYLAKDITALHLQPATIKDCCMQNYKYGLGIAEVGIKLPEVLELEQFCMQLKTNRRRSDQDNFPTRMKKVVRNILATPLFRRAVLAGASGIKHTKLPDSISFKIYRAAIAIYTAAGVQDGEKRFRRPRD